MYKILTFAALVFLIGNLGFANKTLAQQTNPNNPLLYSNQATMFGDQGSAFDPISIIMPGVAYNAGFGSFIDNPASAALFKNSFGQFGLSYRMVDENSQYLGNSSTLDDRQTNLSNFGIVYSFPTTRGSLVAGAGYTQHTSFNRAFGFRGRNNNSTITDNFKAPGSTYSDIAFGTFATDYGDEFEDWDESIFRIGFDQLGDYLGIRQQGEIIQRGYGGEYSMFMATEFQQNLMIGASIGILNGRFKYDRLFQEVDEFNDYDGQIIDSNNDGTGDTDIDRILLEDDLTSRYNGFRVRTGFLYRLNQNLNIGGSYTFGTKIFVDEQFNASITSSFDNGVDFEDNLNTEFSYNVRFPSKASLGFAVKDLNGLTVSASAEYIDYSKTRIEFNDGNLFEDELLENEFIKDTYRPVLNYKAGLSYQFNPMFTVRGGYSYLPSRFDGGSDDRNVFALGAGFSLTDDVRLELAAQYAIWEEETTVYDYAVYNYSDLPDNPPSFSFRSESAIRSVDRWNVLATLKFRLN